MFSYPTGLLGRYLRAFCAAHWLRGMWSGITPDVLSSGRLICFVLILVTLAVFWQVGDCDFINLDDNVYIVKNLHIRDGLTWQGIRWAFGADLWFDSPNADYWQPVTFLSRMLDIQFFGLDPSMHHLMNLAFHIANTLLLFHVLRRMAGRFNHGGHGGSRSEDRTEMSAWAAALFAVHPLRVESVAWVVERKDLLGGFFWMLTIWAYIRYVALPCRRRYGCMLVLFAVGLMSKPVLVTLPLVLLLLDYWPLCRWRVQFTVNSPLSTVHSQQSTTNNQQHARRHGPWTVDCGLMSAWLRLVLEKIPLLALAGLLSMVILGGNLEHLVHDSWRGAVKHALVAYATYLFRTVYPVDLAVWYPHPGGALPISHVLGAILLLGCLTAWVVYQIKRQPFLFVGWCWFLGMLVPTIGLRDVAGADRFTYLPSIGLCIMTVWGAAGVLPLWPGRTAGIADCSSISDVCFHDHKLVSGAALAKQFYAVSTRNPGGARQLAGAHQSRSRSASKKRCGRRFGSSQPGTTPLAQ